MKMKITTQLRLSTLGILAIAFGTLATVFFTVSGKEAHVVNLTGAVRSGTQRSVKLELSGKQNDQLIKKLDGVIKGLINGDKNLGLPKATDQDFILKMQQVEIAWNKVKGLIGKARQNPQYQAELLTASEELFQLAEAAVNSAENISNSHAKTLKNIEIVIFASNVIVVAVIWLIVNNIISTLQGFTGNIATSSTNIASTVDDQERTVTQQATSVNETTTTMDELGAASRQAAEQAEASSSGAQKAIALVDEGTKAVQQTMSGMSMLKEQVRAIAEQIMNLSEQTGQIAGISDLVADLANQTNMLALNAAVEAARAGENGKGFAVVAGEIRKLADESKKSADKINHLVGDIQAAMNSTVMVTDEGTKKTDESIKLTQETAQTFNGVNSAVNEVFVNTQQIFLSAKQQAVAVQQVLSAMNALNLGAQETSAGIQEVKVSTNQLNESAQQLQAAV